MSLGRQVTQNARDIRNLKRSQYKLQQDYVQLKLMQEAQGRQMEEMRQEMKEGNEELKSEFKEAITCLKNDIIQDQKERDERYQREKEKAERKFPDRAHLLFEFVLAGVAFAEFIGQHWH